LRAVGTSARRVIQIAALTLLSLSASGVSAAASSASPCDKFASPHGSDRASGTIAHPFATPSRLISSLRPGQTGCLRGGVYRQDVTVRRGGASGRPIVLRSYPGQRATIVGRLYLARGARYTTIAYLTLVGRELGRACSNMCPSPTVNADDTTFVHDDVTNDHADASCFLLGDSHGVYGPANDTTIEDDHIHDCGQMPPTNYDHGIYVEESYGSKIVDNLIYNNADRGIQLYPQAMATSITGNVIDGNGEGVVFGASGSQSSDDNMVEGNIIINSRVLYNVAGAYGPSDRVGTGNVVQQNCIGGGAADNVRNPGGVRFDHAGFVLAHNTLVTPAASAEVTLSLPAPLSSVSPLSLVPPLPSSLGPLLKRSGPTARAAGLCHGMKIAA
jgi:parallel beta-helix repeat protein